MDKDQKARNDLASLIDDFSLPKDVEHFAVDALGLGRDDLLEFLTACKRSPILSRHATKEQAFEIVFALNSYAQQTNGGRKKMNSPVSFLVTLLNPANRDELKEDGLTYRRWKNEDMKALAEKMQIDSAQADADEIRKLAKDFLSGPFDRRVALIEDAIEFYRSQKTIPTALTRLLTEHSIAERAAEISGGKPQLAGWTLIGSFGSSINQIELACLIVEKFKDGQYVEHVPSIMPEAAHMKVLNADGVSTVHGWSKSAKLFRQRMIEDESWADWAENVYQQSNPAT